MSSTTPLSPEVDQTQNDSPNDTTYDNNYPTLGQSSKVKSKRGTTRRQKSLSSGLAIKSAPAPKNDEEKELLKVQITHLKEDIVNLNNQLAEKQDELEKLRNLNGNNDEVEHLKEEKDRILREKRSAEQQKDAEIKEKEQQINNLTQQLSQQKKLSNENKNNTSQVDELLNKIKKLEDNTEQLRSQLQSTQNDVTKLQEKEKQLNNEKSVLTEKTNQFQNQIKKETDEKKKLIDENTRLRTDASKAQQQVEELQKKVTLLQQDVTKAQEESKKVKNSSSSVEKIQKEKQEEIDNLKKHHTEEIIKFEHDKKQAEQDKKELEEKFSQEKIKLNKDWEDRHNKEVDVLKKELAALRDQIKLKEQQALLDVFKRSTQTTVDKKNGGGDTGAPQQQRFIPSQYSSFALAALSALQQQ